MWQECCVQPADLCERHVAVSHDQPVWCHRCMDADNAMPRGEAAEGLARGALDWILGSARSTGAGLTWAATVPGAEANFSLYNGAAGIVLALLEAQQHFGDDRYGDAAIRGAASIAAAYALAVVGAAAGRRDLVELALEGAADVVARDEAGPEGFVVPHSDPQHRPDLIERYSYGWCNGPAGDAQVFRLLGSVTKDAAWAALADRCWHTVTHCGLPRRIRPGFWDNSGHCCGTAGVLALACDRHVEQAVDLDFADVLVEDLTVRATVDADGVRWSNHEHRTTPSTLEPRTGWAMGNAGIIRELLRFARASTGRRPAYAVDWPDQPGACEAGTLESRS
jgi:hypothetical protein